MQDVHDALSMNVVVKLCMVISPGRAACAELDWGGIVHVVKSGVRQLYPLGLLTI